MLKVLFISSEVSPYAKSGGLGDVAGSLPKALKDMGVDVRVVFPKYKNIKPQYTETAKYIGSYKVKLDWREQSASVYELDSEVTTYIIENDYYFTNRDGYYGYGDDGERFTFFSRAALDLLNIIDFIPDVIHCNDWQSAPVCLYVKDYYKRYVALENVKTLYTIHNLQYQGICGKDCLNLMGLNEGYFTQDKMEFNGMISFMKTGIVYADAVSTVSKTYANEIQTSQYGYGLDGVLRQRKNDLFGIVNGIDYSQDDPATNKSIYVNFDANNLSGKKENKRLLQEELGLPVKDVPMISIISRLVDQKGINLVIDAINELVSKDIQFVVLGTGDGRYEHILKEFECRYPDKISANIMFDGNLAKKIYASSDLFLMPSLFEPCGLGQLFAMSYGTVPIVRTTGGLVDTVTEYNRETKVGNGFAFKDYDANGMLWAINQAISVYNSEDWETVVKNAINTRFSWEISAKEYIDLYEKLKNEK